MLRRFVLIAATLLAWTAVAAQHNVVYLPLVLGPMDGLPAASVRLISASGYRAGTSHYVVGEVRNNTAAAAYEVRIRARLYDTQGAPALIATGEAVVLLGLLLPGHLAPFRAEVRDAPTGIGRFEVDVLSWQTTVRTPYAPAEVLTRVVTAGRVTGSLGVL